MKPFLILSFICLLSTASLLKLLFISIQHGQWLDKLFNWQERIRTWDEQGKTALAKWGGACEICFCAFWTALCVIPYILFVCSVNHWAIENIIGNILWIPMYWSLSTNITLGFITKRFNQKRNDT